MQDIIRDEITPAANQIGIEYAEKICGPSKSPIVILGGNNTITIVKNQHNDQSAVDTLTSFIEEERKRNEGQRKLMDQVASFIKEISGKMVEVMIAKNKQPTAPSIKKRTTKSKK